MPPVGGVLAAGPPGAARTHATGRPRVAEAMLTNVRVHDICATVREIRSLFGNDRVHAAVIVRDGILIAVVERADLTDASDEDAAAPYGRRGPRVVGPHADLEDARRSMIESGRRRLAVVDDHRTFLGLLCLKRTRRGFCSAHDVRARHPRPGLTP